ncbi:helix-turn-helix domain-containing protein [Burkholderia cepacia]|uniref:helix-turn-helix domain-containing protein n=1 Tax=Burkholderia cepacia TaxID=292 RepID=UPI0009BF26D4|nr:helix-turn-helix transcriptional regulator [Burkholderia cepacia]
MNVGYAIRLCRGRRGVSQTDVAQRANCSVSYLSMLENNKRDPTLSTIMKIAEALQVPVGVMFFLASEKEELGQIDEDTVKAIERAALASLQSQVEAAHE